MRRSKISLPPPTRGKSLTSQIDWSNQPTWQDRGGGLGQAAASPKNLLPPLSLLSSGAPKAAHTTIHSTRTAGFCPTPLPRPHSRPRPLRRRCRPLDEVEEEGAGMGRGKAAAERVSHSFGCCSAAAAAAGDLTKSMPGAERCARVMPYMQQRCCCCCCGAGRVGRVTRGKGFRIVGCRRGVSKQQTCEGGQCCIAQAKEWVLKSRTGVDLMVRCVCCAGQVEVKKSGHSER